MDRRVGSAAALAALALYWLVYALTTQFVVSVPRLVEPFSDSAAPLLLGIGVAFAVGLYVGEWWALAVAISPVLPLAALHVTGHIAPYGDETAPLAGWQWWLASIAIPLVIGVGIRKALGSPPRHSTRARNSSL